MIGFPVFLHQRMATKPVFFVFFRCAYLRCCRQRLLLLLLQLFPQQLDVVLLRDGGLGRRVIRRRASEDG